MKLPLGKGRTFKQEVKKRGGKREESGIRGFSGG